MAAVQEIEDFYGVYLLVSKCPKPKFAGRTYIGYTVDPNRRIKQHNSGQDGGGAKRTSNRGPWVMVMIIHGFPNNLSALRFEWAWQQPKVSRRLKAIPELHKKQRKESNFEYNFRILTEMLRIGPWNRLPLTVRWLVDDFHREFEVGKAPPMHMPICFGRVKKVPKKGKVAKKSGGRRRAAQKPSTVPTAKNSKSKPIAVNYDLDVDEYDLLVMGADATASENASKPEEEEDTVGPDDDGITISSDEDEEEPKSNDADLCVICNGAIGTSNGGGFALRCVRPRCSMVCHIECLAGKCLEPGQYVPVSGVCPVCDGNFLWGDLIRKANGCSDLVEDSGNTTLLEVDDVSESEGE
ncbi:structure-specific endonuclease subunit SLX1 homolog isoform X1 [Culex quinquefasciatus]|uniref:structure-specific endonuclease subunit SLX1 homolog isoform X1 n=2 Tax=Culex quinquefasciatus TaxID=7176 RepID=UPI0018E34044|nr:structure-specific endonuclease subunit SLX1 homolog isoform X1 [Culex quinquefasciatus]